MTLTIKLMDADGIEYRNKEFNYFYDGCKWLEAEVERAFAHEKDYINYTDTDIEEFTAVLEIRYFDRCEYTFEEIRSTFWDHLQDELEETIEELKRFMR